MVKQKICSLCGVSIPTTSLGGKCESCLQEHAYIRQKCKYAMRLGLQADLTVSQWNTTLTYFKGLCAYCQKEKWELMEHFIPMVLRGGTTASNCVPDCRSCNSCKYNLHPDQVKSIPREALERVRIFLEGQKSAPK